jgi:hypothetical protein
MPTVDMPGVGQSTNGGGKQGFGTGLPTPVLLIAVGGGLGLVVFLMRRSGTPSSDQSGDKGTLLPNTAIMLGSLQQGILNLQGQVSMGNADLSSQLTGVGENLSSQIDIQSGQIQNSFADLNTYLGSNFTALASSEESLATAIAGLGTQNAGLAESLTSILQQLYGISSGVSNAQNELGLIGGQVSTISGGIGTISGGINTILGNQNSQSSQLDLLTRGTGNIAMDAFNFKAGSSTQNTYLNQYGGDRTLAAGHYWQDVQGAIQKAGMTPYQFVYGGGLPPIGHYTAY